MWVRIRSCIQWSVGLPVMVLYVGTFSLLSLFIPHYKIDFILKMFAKHMVWISGIDLHVFGANEIDWTKPYIIVFN
ncbi:MAG: hypothetical protein KDD48_05220, partial [Bdellovibrionales bacterium]|nr:hypothetical protein [Bdellovibrionales bacterium]